MGGGGHKVTIEHLFIISCRVLEMSETRVPSCSLSLAAEIEADS